MTFVVYDLETTGLRKGFDQILHFGAIRTDAGLNEVGRFEIQSRVLPHVVPSPGAFHLTGLRIEDIFSEQLPTHYDMVCQIVRTLSAWCPAVFLGYNSIQFDEEFLRQAFYQCLHRPFLTNTNGSARADVLKLVRAVAAMHPQVLTAPSGEDGRASFRLGEIARANGVNVSNGHHAMADVEATLSLCRIVRQGAPDLWSRFLRFAQKATVVDFVREEEAFLLFEYFGSRQDVHVLTVIGVNDEQPNIYYCLDLAQDLSTLQALEPDALVHQLTSEPRPVRRLKVNTAPMLCPLSEGSPAHLGELTEEIISSRAAAVRADEEFMRRLATAAKACERVYERSPHVEQQLYGHGFPSDADHALMDAYHTATWEGRVGISIRFEDARLRRLARRLIYFERPDLLGEGARAAREEIGRRLLGDSAEASPWLTIPEALGELETLLPNLDSASHDRLSAYKLHLAELRARLLAS